ncbi:ATP-dependent helicase [Vibrio coralliirubri]|uniref:ATP-dependent helicase n=1 Tax=Vibrio coralliirubri TaxID=1516159 RepID=UPI00228527B3|nr:ATP-dependent helicase [Vibrio coralliirubri]MCY9861035.1 ATP-dependent helicase [Vibrio coralliirubri]
MTTNVKASFERLNAQQKVSVREDNKRLLVLAGAGTGKTSMLVVRVARHLIKDKFNKNEIVGLTFTNKAGNELKAKVEDIVGRDVANGMFFGTFHSFCVRLLRKNHESANLPANFQILDETDKKRLLKSIHSRDKDSDIALAKLHAKEAGWTSTQLKRRVDEIKFEYTNLKDAIKLAIEVLGYAKNRGHGVEWIESHLSELAFKSSLSQELCEYTSKLAKSYESEKERLFMLDFDDLIIRTNSMLSENKILRQGIQNQIKALLIDEFQDTNVIQYDLMKLLINRQTMLTVVGDEDQLIYEWRGAILEHILDFCTKENGVCIKLEQNYRSTKSILCAANEVIGNNKNRHGKTLFTANDIGMPIYQTFYSNAYDEADAVVREIVNLHRDGVKFKDIAVLYRNKSMSGAIGNSLHKHSIPSVVYGGMAFWERLEIKDVMAFLKWVNNDSNALAIQRILERFKVGYGEKKHIEVTQIAEKDGFTYGQALLKFAESGKETALKAALKTILAFKESATKLYETKGIHGLVSHVVSRSGLLDVYKKSEDQEVVAERHEHMLQIVENAAMFTHEEVDADDKPLDDLMVFLANADLQVEAQAKKGKDSDCVSLMTMHSSKGLEYEYVFIIGAENANFPSPMRVSQREIEEERRLAYVAITRGKKKVMMSGARQRLNKTSTEMSLFAKEISTKYKIFSDKSFNSFF